MGHSLLEILHSFSESCFQRTFKQEISQVIMVGLGFLFLFFVFRFRAVVKPYRHI